MRFSVGVWDALFGERVTLELPGPDGQLIRRRVTLKWLKQMEALGMANKLEGEFVRVHVLYPSGSVNLENIADPDELFDSLTASKNHYRVETWRIGSDISAEDAENLRDKETGDIYAVAVYENGKQRMRTLPRELWQQGKAQMDEIDMA